MLFLGRNTRRIYKDLSARVEGEYSGGSTSLTYGYFDINRWAPAKIRLGQFKPFYGLERSMSTNFIDLISRSAPWPMPCWAAPTTAA